MQTDEFTDVTYEVENGLAWITINRPERYNAFRARTVCLTGAGDKAFCTGGDQKQRMESGEYGPSDTGLFEVDALHRVIRDVPKPVIAAVNGFAIGGGHVLHLQRSTTQRRWSRTKPLAWSGRLTIATARSQILRASRTNRPVYPASAHTSTGGQGVDGLVRREVGRQGPPRDPAADQVEDRVQDQAPAQFSGLPPRPPVLLAAGSSGASSAHCPSVIVEPG